MNRILCFSWLVSVGFLLAAGCVEAAPPTNPQVLYSFCYGSSCTDEQDAFGMGAQDVVAGPDGVYYGTTHYSNIVTTGPGGSGNIDGGGSIYRYDPTTRSISVLYQFARGYYPASWLKAGPDGTLYGGYTHSENANSDWISEGFFSLSPAGEFTIINEAGNQGFVCNEPVRDSLGRWVGVTDFYSSPNSIYRLGSGGVFTILHTFASNERFGCPNRAPVLASDGNMYGVIQSEAGGTIFRVTPDDAFSVVYAIDATTEGFPLTSLTMGSDGALYGIMHRPDEPSNRMYRVSLDGQFTDLGTFGPGKFSVRQKLTLMPDGLLYGSGRAYGNGSDDVIFRLSPAGEYTQLFVNTGVVQNSSISKLIRGFDNALYGTVFYGGNYGRGVLFRYVPPPAPLSSLKRAH